jgi:hypothetical protein
LIAHILPFCVVICWSFLHFVAQVNKKNEKSSQREERAWPANQEPAKSAVNRTE